MTVVHALDGVTVADQVTSDDVGNRGVIVNDDNVPGQITSAHTYTLCCNVPSEVRKWQETSADRKMYAVHRLFPITPPPRS